jgi:Tfp pilus assembly protein PilV
MSTHRARFSPRSTRALTLIEVMIASLVLTLVMVSSLNVLIQNRKVTETSIFQNAAMTVIQGYMEQIKEAKFSTVPYYKDGVLVPANTDDPIQGLASENRTKAIKTYLNNTDVDTMGNEEGETIIDYLLISSGTPIADDRGRPGRSDPEWCDRQLQGHRRQPNRRRGGRSPTSYLGLGGRHLRPHGRRHPSALHQVNLSVENDLQSHRPLVCRLRPHHALLRPDPLIHHALPFLLL